MSAGAQVCGEVPTCGYLTRSCVCVVAQMHIGSQADASFLKQLVEDTPGGFGKTVVCAAASFTRR